MPAPAPTGSRLTDGFPTKINFISTPNVELWQVEITPPGVEGGGPNNLTSMENTAWRTAAPKKLKTLTETVTTCGYDPKFYSTLLSMLQVNQQLKVWFSDGATLTFWGWLEHFKPNAVKEGAEPTASVRIEASNRDNTGAEVPPVYTAPA
jgi:hypothetical protein